MAKGKGKKDYTNTLLIVGGFAALYFLTKPVDGSAPTIPGKDTFIKETNTTLPGQNTTTWLKEIIDNTIVNPVAQVGTGLAEVPGQVVIGVPKKMITKSEERTSTEVFGDVGRTNVSTFLATEKPGTVFTGPITYKKFIQEQPILFRAAAGTGNIITGQEAARYGAYSALQTKKGIAASGRDPAEYEQRFAGRIPLEQTFIGLGQALTVPFGGGGAVGWGSSFGKWLYGR